MAHVHILGAGTPTPTAHRFGSSFVLQIGDQYLMFDCGPSTTWKLVKAGLFPTQIGYLFFTHHHFDHDVDYPCFLLTRWDQSTGKEKELEVFGPTITEKLTHRLLDEKEGAFAHDWIARINNPASQHVHVRRGGTLPRKPPTVLAKDVGPGRLYVGDDWEVTAAVGQHAEPWLDSLAYRVNTPDGSIVFMGDTRPCPTVLELARGADVLIAACWDDQDRIERFRAEFGSEGMPGTLDAGRFAQSAAAKKLVLVHTGHELARHGDMEKGIGDIAKVYDGQIVFSEELMSFPMTRR
jgi:ribonuclease BN (tRNA processing enzyme)